MSAPQGTAPKGAGGGRDDLAAMLGADVKTRMRWWACLNSWRVPADLPVALPDFGPGFAVRLKNPAWRATFDALSESLSDAEKSLGWWVFSSLGESPEAWRKWWTSPQRNGDSAEADNAIAALAKAGGES